MARAMPFSFGLDTREGKAHERYGFDSKCMEAVGRGRT